MEREVWVVRADKSIAERVEKASLIAIGWDQMGDLTGLKTKEQFQDKYQRIYDSAVSKVVNAANQLYRFVIEIHKGDYVLTPLSSSREILIGEITSDYSYDPQAISQNFPNIRSVKWLKKISRDELSSKLRGSSGSIMTVFSVNKYLSEIEKIIGY